MHELSKCACGWKGACHCAGSPLTAGGSILAWVLATAVSQVRNSQLCGSWSAESDKRKPKRSTLNAEKKPRYRHAPCMYVCVCVCIYWMNFVVSCGRLLVCVRVWELWAGEAHACTCVGVPRKEEADLMTTQSSIETVWRATHTPTHSHTHVKFDFECGRVWACVRVHKRFETTNVEDWPPQEFSPACLIYVFISPPSLSLLCTPLSFTIYISVGVCVCKCVTLDTRRPKYQWKLENKGHKNKSACKSSVLLFIYYLTYSKTEKQHFLIEFQEMTAGCVME